VSAVEQPKATYPLPRTDDDRRFTFGLVYDVAKVLAEHGYPAVSSGGDFVRLQQALFGFIYEQPEDPR
jgi:hypothetical protein